MTHKERFINAISHKQPDCIPLDLGGTRDTSIVIEGYEKLKRASLESYESQVKLFGEKSLDKFFRKHHSNWDSSELFMQAKI